MLNLCCNFSQILFQASKHAGWLSSDENTYPKASHLGFGTMWGEDGEVVKMIDILDKAKSLCKAALIERGVSSIT